MKQVDDILTVGTLKEIIKDMPDNTTVAVYNLDTGNTKILYVGDVDTMVEGMLEFNVYEYLENRNNSKNTFVDDNEKMKDFYVLSKEEFLKSYSYLTDAEYEATKKQVDM